MEAENVESKPEGGSSQPVEIPQTVSTHSVGGWPKVNIQQSANYESDLRSKTYNVGGSDITVWEEVGVRVLEPAYFDRYADPDRMIDTIFSSINIISKLLVDPKKMYMERRGKSYKLTHYDVDRFTPPPQTAPSWKQRNYEMLLDKLVEYTERTEDIDIISNDTTKLRDWGGPTAGPYLSSFLNDRIREADDPFYQDDDYSAGLGLERLSKASLGNRFDTALVLDTPRKTMALWKFFSLIHSGFPWFKGSIQFEGLWRNFKVPLYVRSCYEIFNSYVCRLPNYPSNLKIATESMSDAMLGGLAENLTYDPPMFDVGASVLNIGIEVSNHVNAMIRSHVKMESVSYMEVSSLLMQMSSMSTNRASSLSAFTATLNNSAASSAFEPVLNALACGFTKISLDLPSNARQATVMMVVSLMTYPSCIYDNQTRALIHNMFVGMVMVTSQPLNMGRVVTESTVDFASIRKLSSEHKLMPTPILPSNDGNRAGYIKAQIARDAMIRLLMHYHGIYVGDDEKHPGSISNTLWSPGRTNDIRYGYAVDENDIHTPTYSEHYFDWWGTIPNPNVSRDSYLRDLMPAGRVTIDENGVVTEVAGNEEAKIPRNIIASSFDMMVIDDPAVRPEIVRKTIEARDYMIFGNAGSRGVYQDVRAHGQPVTIHGRHYRNGRWFALGTLSDKTMRGAFSDDVVPIKDKFLDLSDRTNVMIYDTERQAPVGSRYMGQVPGLTSYLFDESDVTYLSGITNPIKRLRPKLRSILPVRGMSDESGVMSETLKSFISDVIQPILASASVIGETKYIENLGTLMFNQRWAQFMDYITESAAVTMLTDYSPFGYTPMIIDADAYLNSRDPLSSRSGSPARTGIVNRRAATAARSACITLFDSPVNDQNVRGETILSKGYWRYEPEPSHRTISLEPSSLLALSLLGVAPATPPDVSGSLALNLDSKAFNNDVAVMKTSAKLFMDTYNTADYEVLGRFDALSPVYKLDKFKAILSKMRAMFPVVSPLTSQLDKSMETYDLRQNHFWRSSPYIDAEFKMPDGVNVNMMDSFQIPYLKHRPIVPMVNSNTMNCGSLGYQDTLFSQMHEAVRSYYEHKLSRIDIVTTLAVIPSTRIDNNVARTRTYRQGSLPIPIGAPYILPQYLDAPMVESRWLYSIADADIDLEYDMYDAIKGKDGLLGVTPSRPHSMVYSDWKYQKRKETRDVLLKHSVVNRHGMKLVWGETSDLQKVDMMIPTPDVSDFHFPDLTVTAYYTSPSAYVGKQQEIMDMSGIPTGVIPVLSPNQGPFICRLEERSASWPASANFTDDGALTENIMSNAPEGAGDNSCEYNTEMIGIVPTRSKPLNIVDPSPMLVLVRDPLATWARL